MLKFNFNNCGFAKSALTPVAKKLSGYISDLAGESSSGVYESPESFMLLVNDSDTIAAIKKLASEKADSRLKRVVVIGIGGSVAGTEAVAYAVKSKHRIMFIDSIDPEENADKLTEIRKLYGDGGHCLFVVVSKSGHTIETTANFSIVMELIKPLDKDWRRHFVFITIPNSPLHVLGDALKVDSLLIRPVVSGRFSIFSAVGLFPLAVAGVDIDEVLSGARHMLGLGLDRRIDKNPALLSASSIYLNLKKKRSIFNNFIFSKRLEHLGGFLSDIMAESLGKDGSGITPIVSMSSPALHSLGQLLFGGPRDKFTCFIYPESFIFDPKVRGTTGLSLGRLTKAILKGTLSSYRKNKLPYYEISFDKLSERILGEVMQMKMMETVYLGKLMKVNAFNQPAVEDYKKAARRYL